MNKPAGTIIGVDGCPGGWLAVVVTGNDFSTAELAFRATFAEIASLVPAPELIAVDMPIGLPERAGRSGRACEVEVRARLGARQSSVFSIPARSAVMESDYGAACAAALAASEPPRKVSRQAFNLFPKIREIDALVRADASLAARIFECHPELAFWAMRGDAPADYPKKVKSRPNPAGLDERRRYLEAEGFDAAFLSPGGRLPGRAGADDLLDAAACAWTARRISRGEAHCFPAVPPCDAHGLAMAIRA